MTGGSTGRIRGVPGIDPGTGEYVVTPAERARNWDEQLTAALSGNADPDGPRHVFDVERVDGSRLLAVVEHGGSDAVDGSGTGSGRLIGATERHFLFQLSAGDPLLVLDRGGLTTTYTLRAAPSGDAPAAADAPETWNDPAAGAVLATWSRSLAVVGDWRLAAPDGTVRARVEPDGSAGRLLPVSTGREYVVRSADGVDLARFERTRLDGELAGTGLSELSVSIERCAIPGEVCLALGVGVLVEAGQPGRVGHGGTRGP